MALWAFFRRARGRRSQVRFPGVPLSLENTSLWVRGPVLFPVVAVLSIRGLGLVRKCAFGLFLDGDGHGVGAAPHVGVVHQFSLGGQRSERTGGLGA